MGAVHRRKHKDGFFYIKAVFKFLTLLIIRHLLTETQNFQNSDVSYQLNAYFNIRRKLSYELISNWK